MACVSASAIRSPDFSASPRFTDEQRWWLEKMAEHIASNLGLEADDFELPRFNQRGGLGEVHQLFGAELPSVLTSLNEALAA
jgi:type I restriction enzyme R subunit